MIQSSQRSPLPRRSPHAISLLTSSGSGRTLHVGCDGAWCTITKGDDDWTTIRRPSVSNFSGGGTSRGQLQPVTETLVLIGNVQPGIRRNVVISGRSRIRS